ncbi:MAG: MerR family transcriptional regulator [Coriobacteriaceae bacterium]|jgi:DNA-binding transcriptional MerR regulator|nr:MerR family transcriptional regulator [Coriobacteriaceae bacterium]
MVEFGIGRMADLNCVSEKALRLYQQKGLLEPIRVDESTGYRYYSYEQCSTVDMIQQLQYLGVSLDEIKQLHDSHAIENLAEVLEARLCAIDEEMLDLRVAKRNAELLMENYRILTEKSICDQVILEHLPVRRLITFPLFNERAIALSQNVETFLKEWELNLRLTKRHMRDAGMPLSLFHRVGCSIDKEDLLARDFRLKSSFILVDEVALELLGDAANLGTIAEGAFLTLFKSRYTDVDGSNAELNGLQAILDYAQAHGFQIAGDYWGEIVAETPAFLYEGREMLFKLQIPVRVA